MEFLRFPLLASPVAHRANLRFARFDSSYAAFLVALTLFGSSNETFRAAMISSKGRSGRHFRDSNRRIICMSAGRLIWMKGQVRLSWGRGREIRPDRKSNRIQRE